MSVVLGSLPHPPPGISVPTSISGDHWATNRSNNTVLDPGIEAHLTPEVKDRIYRIKEKKERKKMF